ncbi:uncharacterized protein DSM5745_05481 [Aspergillus mulundensis]|uniref:Uncharacterized protein n=1 Tax=Aspergillus mulundensis TaxID=1810919 RepID=A0A3D8RX36_9EURO|nr:hypothetical protein DSM5745_05481 [Aspergillus mulundensis]RDW78629.1 hypothetical protein DSM5745_05481 [Aspergillus mulundensis]
MPPELLFVDFSDAKSQRLALSKKNMPFSRRSTINGGETRDKDTYVRLIYLLGADKMSIWWWQQSAGQPTLSKALLASSAYLSLRSNIGYALHVNGKSALDALQLPTETFQELQRILDNLTYANLESTIQAVANLICIEVSTKSVHITHWGWYKFARDKSSNSAVLLMPTPCALILAANPPKAHSHFNTFEKAHPLQQTKVVRRLPMVSKLQEAPQNRSSLSSTSAEGAATVGTEAAPPKHLEPHDSTGPHRLAGPHPLRRRGRDGAQLFEAQPIKNAKYYFLSNNMHDYPDERCTILQKNIVPPMRT